MDKATVEHVNAMLAHATQLHKEAVAEIELGEGDPIPQIREAIDKLDSVLLLANDAATYLHDDQDQMLQVIEAIHEQKAMLKVTLLQIEAKRVSSPWSRPWPWLSLLLIAIAIFNILG